MENTKIVLLCGGPFSYRSLSALAYSNYLAGVVIGTNNNYISSSLKIECEKSSIPFLCIDEQETLMLLDDFLKTINPSAIFSICFPFLIPEKTLSLFSKMFINFHTGPLPKYRGPMPIFEVLRKQEKNTAISVHFMNEMYDQGELIYAETIAISEEDTYTSLALKLSERCGLMALNVAEMLDFGSSIPTHKQDEQVAFFHPFPKKEALIINWKEMTAEEIIALIKACNGWNNGAITIFKEESIHLIDVDSSIISTTCDSLPGTLIQLNENGSGIIACTQNKQIQITNFGNENGLYSSDYLNQIGILRGIRFD